MTGIIIIAITVIFSYRGLRSDSFFDQYVLEVDKIIVYKEYKRLISSGLLHLSWLHLIFNMLALYFFMGAIENTLGEIPFLIIYFSGLLGGNLLALFVHRNHGDYSCAGASGAVCGILFSCIALFPGFGIGFFGLPFSIPGWLYGPAFVLFSIYGIKSKTGNTGNEAHLGGALIGMVAALLFSPAAFFENYIIILLIAVPSILFIYFIITRPHILITNNFFPKKNKDFYSIDHKYNAERNSRQKEIDNILDKINRKGINSLTAKEKEKLDEYSR
jgi:membrane associated rhomboid family serine protease